jgi:hypothetical protein
MDDAPLSFAFEAELGLPPLATLKQRTDVVCRLWLRRRCAKDQICVQLHIYDEARLPVCLYGAPCANANKFRDVPCIMQHRSEDDKDECVNYRLGFCRCVRRACVGAGGAEQSAARARRAHFALGARACAALPAQAPAARGRDFGGTVAAAPALTFALSRRARARTHPLHALALASPLSASARRASTGTCRSCWTRRSASFGGPRTP